MPPLPTGFAFIEFEDPLDAVDAVKDMDGRRVCGVTIKCELAKGTSRFVYDNAQICVYEPLYTADLEAVVVVLEMSVEAVDHRQ